MQSYPSAATLLPSVGSLHNSMSVLSQDQIDDASPFAPPTRWIPAYAGMTVVVQSTPSRSEHAGGARRRIYPHQFPLMINGDGEAQNQ